MSYQGEGGSSGGGGSSESWEEDDPATLPDQAVATPAPPTDPSGRTSLLLDLFILAAVAAGFYYLERHR